MKFFKEIKWVNRKSISLSTNILNLKYIDLSLSYLYLNEIEYKYLGYISFENPIDTFLVKEFIKIDIYSYPNCSVVSIFQNLNQKIIEALAKHEYKRLYDLSKSNLELNYQNCYTTKFQQNKINFKFKIPTDQQNDTEAYNLIKQNIKDQWLDEVPQFSFTNISVLLSHTENISLEIEFLRYFKNQLSKEIIKKDHKNILGSHGRITHTLLINPKLELDGEYINYAYIVKVNINSSEEWHTIAVKRNFETIDHNSYAISITERLINKITIKILDSTGQPINTSGYCLLHFSQ
jgi:hypothetical protein